MRNTRRSGRSIAELVAIAAIGFLLWIGVLLVLWSALNAAGVPTEFWAMAQTLTSTLTMVSILGGSILAVHQLGEAAPATGIWRSPIGCLRS
jgi:uncharacterized membrane protein